MAVLLPLLLPPSSDLTVGLYGAMTGLSWSSEGKIMVLGVIRGLRVGLGAILIEWVVWLCYIDEHGRQSDSVKTVTVLGKPDKQSHRVLRNGFVSAAQSR